MHDAVNREAKAVRDSVDLDASTLGKIDVQGPEFREFMNRVYTNGWAKLDVGNCRYGLMCGEDGTLFDDGVTAVSVIPHFDDHHHRRCCARLRVARTVGVTEWPDLVSISIP